MTGDVDDAPEAALVPALEALFASDPVHRADPWPLWADLLHAAPVTWVGHRAVVSRHADVKALLRDDERLSSRWFIDGKQAESVMAGLDETQRAAHLEISAFESMYVSRSDGAQHERLRNIAHRAFTPRRIAELRDAAQGYTDALLDDLSGTDEWDLVSGFAYPLPLMVIAEMLGVPADERELIHGWSNRLGRNRGGTDPVALMDAHAALTEFRAYVAGVIDVNRGRPAETNLVAALMDASSGDRLTADELTAMFVILLFAGHETTTNLIATGLLELHRGEDQWRALCGEPERSTAGVEELLRWVSPVQWTMRVAVADITVGAQSIGAGETVVLAIAAANRDAARFEAPWKLDLGRADAKQHVALGFGPHFCLGASLARLEGDIAFRTLAERLPDMQVQVDGLEWRGNALLRGLGGLRVRPGLDRGRRTAARKVSA